MKTGISTIALRKYDVFRALELAKSYGFDGVEIWGRAPHTPDVHDEAFTKQIAEKMASLGLSAAMVGSYVRPGSDDFEARSEQALAIAEIIDAKIIRVWAGAKEPPDADEPYFDMVASAFSEYAKKAADKGVVLAMEMHGGTLCKTAEGAMKIIEKANVDNLKMNYQVNGAPECDWEREVDMLGDYIVNVHAQNHKPENGKMELAWINDGVLDYDQIIPRIAEHGFDGYVEVEFLRGEFAEDENVMLESLKMDSQYLRELVSKYGAK